MRKMSFWTAGASIAITMCFSGISYAGDGNRLFILQQSSLGGGNSLTVDQSNASGSLVTGLDASGNATDDGSTAATQKGFQNSATLTIEGSGGVITLLQDNSASQLSGVNGNMAEIYVNGAGALGNVSQLGTGNSAKLNVTGPLSQGSIAQNGSFNDAELTVANGAMGEIVQNGDGNVTPLEVQSPGTSVSYTVQGNNMTSVLPTGVQVYSTGAAVTIVQTNLP